MQDTIEKYEMNKTSILDRWMLSDSSKIINSGHAIGQLRGLDWNSRYILANILYFNSINALDDELASRFLIETFFEGHEAGQILIAPFHQSIYSHMEKDDDSIPSYIESRVIAYQLAIAWTVAKPSHDYVSKSYSSLGIKERQILKLAHDDGTFSLKLGGQNSDTFKLGRILNEVNTFILGAQCDLEDYRFSTHDKMVKTALFIKKYLSEKWNLKFKVIDNDD